VGVVRSERASACAPRARGEVPTVEELCRALERLGLMVTTVCVDVAPGGRE